MTNPLEVFNGQLSKLTWSQKLIFAFVCCFWSFIQTPLPKTLSPILLPSCSQGCWCYTEASVTWTWFFYPVRLCWRFVFESVTQWVSQTCLELTALAQAGLKHTCLLPTPRKCCDDHGQHPCFWSCLSVSGHLVFSTFIDETAFFLKCLLGLLKIWNTHYKLTSPLCWATHQTLLCGSAVSLWPQWPFADFKGRQFKSHSFVRFAKGAWVTGAICRPTQTLE